MLQHIPKFGLHPCQQLVMATCLLVLVSFYANGAVLPSSSESVPTELPKTAAELEQQLLRSARDPDELSQNQQLIRSLRNQALLTEQAAAQAVQLGHQLQAAQTLAELRKLGSAAMPETQLTGGNKIDLNDFSLRGFVETQAGWLAEFEYRNERVKVRAGQRLLGAVTVSKRAAGMILSYQDQQRTLNH